MGVTLPMGQANATAQRTMRPEPTTEKESAMKTGRDLQALAAELQRQADTKKDYIAPMKAVSMLVGPLNEGGNVPAPRLHLGNGDTFGITSTGHEQIATHADIPRKYYDRMLTAKPELLASNVNAWFGGDTTKRMVRTLDGNARALLSDKFRPLDNVDLAESILPVLIELNCQIVSCEVTERRLYIKAVDNRIQRDIKTGHRMGDGTHHIFDTCVPALSIRNSEIGGSSLAFEVGVLTKGCTNLAFFSQRSMKKYHVGGRSDVGDNIAHLLSDKTRKVADAALWMQSTDVVKAAFREAEFASLVEEIGGATQDKIEDVVKVVERTAAQFKFNDGERKSVLDHLIQGGDLSRYGLFNAITRAAEDQPDYDRASDMERIGGQVIELKRGEWRQIAEAA